MNFVFLGAPGSGKGTQAAMLAEKLKIKTISTGEALRKEVLLQSEIGKDAKSYMDSGQLVPDNVVVGIIKKQLTEGDCDTGFILDGFPRNIKQAEDLGEMLLLIGKKIDIVFDFQVAEEVLIKRIAGRFSCKNCSAVYNRYFKVLKKEGICDECRSNQFDSRSDDNEVTVINRLKVYHNSTAPLIEYYKKIHLLLPIDAVKSAPLVFEELVGTIRKASIQ